MVRDGYIYGLSLLAVSAVLVWATGGNWAWSIAPLLLAAFFLWFFRDPQRTVPADPGLIVSPGDGLVTETVAIATPDGPRQRISIFLSVFDVHVNRSPIGERFTCTSKTLRKMLIRCRGPSGVAMATVSVTSPSPGETINPGSAGTVRWGSRKNHRKNAAKSRGAIDHAQLPPVAQTSTADTASKLKP